MPEYVSYYPGADPAYVLTADRKHFPRRATAAEAVQDMQDAWHRPNHWDVATHLTVYEIDGETVTERPVRVKRETVLL